MITGVAGSGMLVAHYFLTTSEERAALAYEPVPPTYRFLQSATVVDYTPNIPSSPPGQTCGRKEGFDVSSPVVFGTPVPFGVGLQISMNFTSGNPQMATTADLQLTKYSVFDTSGRLISEAQVIRSFASGPDVFVPELSSANLAAFSILLLATREGWIATRRRRR